MVKGIEEWERALCKKQATAYAENLILERIVNTFLQSEDTPPHLVSEVLKGAGTLLFHKFPDGTHSWKGIE